MKLFSTASFSILCLYAQITFAANSFAGWDSFMSSAVSQAQSAGKKLLAEEWGSLYSSSDSSRVANLNSNVQKMNSYGVAWLYWELITNTDPHQGEDYEVRSQSAQLVQ